MARSSPLASLTRSEGATFTEAAGWELPLHYRDALAEYESTLKEASLFDLSHHGKLEVVGPDASTFLHNLCTNDIKNLPLGGGCEAYFCNVKAKTLAHAFIYHVLLADGKHGFFLDVTPGFGEKLWVISIGISSRNKWNWRTAPRNSFSSILQVRRPEKSSG